MDRRPSVAVGQSRAATLKGPQRRFAAAPRVFRTSMLSERIEHRPKSGIRSSGTVALFAPACWVDVTAPRWLSSLHWFVGAGHPSGQTHWRHLPARFAVVPACLVWPTLECFRLFCEPAMSPKPGRA